MTNVCCMQHAGINFGLQVNKQTQGITDPLFKHTDVSLGQQMKK